jgi:hypothetical protein
LINRGYGGRPYRYCYNGLRAKGGFGIEARIHPNPEGDATLVPLR